MANIKPENKTTVFTAGILFALLVEANKRCEEYKVKAKEWDIYKEFVNIIAREYGDKYGDHQQSFENAARNFKRCERQQPIYNLEDYLKEKDCLKGFDNWFTFKFNLHTKNADELLTKYVPDDTVAAWLATAIVQTIIEDDTIPDETVFYYVEEEHVTITRNDLKSGKCDSFLLAALFLGAYFYTIINIADNTKGADTYNAWFKSPEDTESTHRKIVYDISNNYSGTINIYRDVDDFNSNLNTGKLIAYKPSAFKEYNEDETEYYKYLNKTYKESNRIYSLLYKYSYKEFYQLYVCGGATQLNDRSDIVPFPVSYEKGLNLLNLSYCGERVYDDFIIEGRAGAGKSVLMKNILLRAIENYRTDKVLPILLDAREYKFNGELEECIYKKFVRMGGECSLDEFYNKLKAGRFIILFDGLDEAYKRQTEELAILIEHFAEKYDSVYCVATSRPVMDFSFMHRFQYYEMDPFTKGEALALIDKLEFRSDKPDIKENFKKTFTDTLYKKYPNFSNNPLLITLMLMTFGATGEVPSQIHKIYEEAYKVLLETHDADKGLTRELYLGCSKEKFSQYFMEFCSDSFDDSVYEYEKKDILKYFLQIPSAVKDGIEDRGADFLKDAHDSFSLLIKDGNIYEFIHRGLQEYMTALCLSELDDDEFSEIGQGLIEDPELIRTDNIFEFLYSIKPEKVKKYILGPYLEKVLAGKSYDVFLQAALYEIVYRSKIEYHNGEITPFHENVGERCKLDKDPVIQFIIQFVFGEEYNPELSFSTTLYDDLAEFVYLYPDDTPDAYFTSAKIYIDHEKYNISEKLTMFSKRAFQESVTADCSARTLEDAFTTLCSDFSAIIYSGIEIKNLLINKDNYQDLWNYLSSEDCPLYKIYEKLDKLINEIEEEKKSSHRSLAGLRKRRLSSKNRR